MQDLPTMQPIAIISDKIVNGTTCYKIQWNSTNGIVQTWQPVSSLYHHMLLVIEYQQRLHIEQNVAKKAIPKDRSRRKKIKKQKRLNPIDQVRQSQEASYPECKNAILPQQMEQQTIQGLNMKFDNKKSLKRLTMVEGQQLQNYYAQLVNEQNTQSQIIKMCSQDLLQFYPIQFLRFLESIAFPN